MKPDSGWAQAGLGLSLYDASYHLQADEHLRQALLWLTLSPRECQLRVSVQEALAEVRYEELLRTPAPESAPQSKAELTEQAYMESVEIFSQAVQVGRQCGELQQDRYEMVVATLMKKAWFAQGIVSAS